MRDSLEILKSLNPIILTMLFLAAYLAIKAVYKSISMSDGGDLYDDEAPLRESLEKICSTTRDSFCLTDARRLLSMRKWDVTDFKLARKIVKQYQ